MNCSMPGFPILHCLPEFAQTHVHWVSDTIQPFHSLLPSFLPALNLFQHQGLFQWVGSLHQMAKVLELQFQHQFFQWIFGTPCCPRDSQESSPTPQFESINFSALSLLYVQFSHPYRTIGKTIALTRWTFVGKVMSLPFNTLSRFVVAFLPRSKRLLILWW